MKELFTNYIYGYYGDPFAKLAAIKQSGLHLLGGQSLQWAIFLTIQKLTNNEVLTYNIVTILSYLFCFAATYFFAKYVTTRNDKEKQRASTLVHLPALLAGLIFTTSQYLHWQGTQHLELVLAAGFLPLYFWRLLEYRRAVSYKNAFWLAVTFSATFLTSFYYGYFLMLITGGLIAIGLVRRQGVRLPNRLRLLTTTGLLFIALSTIFTLPATTSLVKYKLGIDTHLPEVSGVGTSIEQNSVDEIFRLTARPWDYFLPSSKHPVFGKYVANFYKNINPEMSWQLWSAYLPERAIYIGYTALALASLAVWQIIDGGSWMMDKRKRTKKFSIVPARPAGGHFQLSIIATITIVAIWLSLPPYVSIHLYKIPISPSYFLFKLFPVFRAYIRIAVLIQLGIAVLAGIGFQVLASRLTRLPAAGRFARKLKPFSLVTLVTLVTFVTLVILILFENLSLPLPFTKVNQSLSVEDYTLLSP
jgi:hypothetical protein